MVLGLAMIEGLVGVYGIHARPNSIQAEISTGQNGEISPDDPRVINFSVPVIPGSYDDRSKVDSGIGAEIEGCDRIVFLRIEPAKAYRQPRIREGKYIDVDLSAQSLSLFEDGKLLDSYVVSTGKSGMETPRGTHVIANKSSRAWSKKYGVFLPYWMAITPGGSFGIHELPECPDGGKEGAAQLGRPVSHGCVRLGIGPAERVFDWAEIGTPVVVY